MVFVRLLTKYPHCSGGLEITNFEIENTLETLYRIHYEKHANKESNTSSSIANIELSLGASSVSYVAQFLSQKKQKGAIQSFVSSSNILG